MARAAVGCLPVKDGVVITKYGHAAGDLPGVRIFEAAHPVPDANSYRATQAAINLVASLRADDTVLFLVSGGGSALFEKPLIPDEEMADITRQLLACGADIQEINTLRKRLSAVKGGKFGELCKPARVFSIVLSDIIGQSAGYDRFRPRLSGQLHNRGRAGHHSKIPAQALRSGHAADADGSARIARQCGNRRHREASASSAEPLPSNASVWALNRVSSPPA